MKEFMKKILPGLVASLGCFIVGGIIATFLGEKVGYSFIFAYMYGLAGHKYVSELIEKKVK